jgi:hypothetical protein
VYERKMFGKKKKENEKLKRKAVCRKKNEKRGVKSGGVLHGRSE